MDRKEWKRVLKNPGSLNCFDHQNQECRDISAELRRIVTYFSNGNIGRALKVIATWIGRAISGVEAVEYLTLRLGQEVVKSSCYNDQVVLLRYLLEATIARNLASFSETILTEGKEILAPDTVAQLLFELRNQRGCWLPEEEELFDQSLAKAREGNILTDDSLFRSY